MTIVQISTKLTHLNKQTYIRIINVHAVNSFA